MGAELQIADGSPGWVSPSILPSKDKVLSPGSSPSLATVEVNSTGVFVYVKVENTGTVDFGACACTVAVPAPWPSVVLLPGFHSTATSPPPQTVGGVTFTARPATAPAGDTLSGAVQYSFGIVAGDRRAWGWSPDGQLFAHVKSISGGHWWLTVVALADITRANGTVVKKGQVAVTDTGMFGGVPSWTNANFGWAGSQAVVAQGPYPDATGIMRSVACPEAPAGSNRWGDLIPATPGQVDWKSVASPCGSVVAFVPRILVGPGSRDVVLVSTSTAKEVEFRRNNTPTNVSIVGANPSLTTRQRTAKGIDVRTGAGATVEVDDPDCAIGGAAVVVVDRVKAGTVPGVNLGVVPVGIAALGSLAPKHSVWVQVPNANPSGWENQGERHWCLVAQAYTADGTTIPRAWTGQPTSSAFPQEKQNCAQRNIAILP
jgi:hypothetical protein